MNGGLQPHKRGFFCNDTTIQYPFVKDTVSFSKLIVIAQIIPWIIIRLLERTLDRLLANAAPRSRSKSVQGDRDDSPRSRAEKVGLMESNDQVKRRLVINGSEDSSDTEIQADEEQAGLKSVQGNGNEKKSDISEVGFRMLSTKRNLGKVMSDVQIFQLGLATCTFLTGVGKMACGRHRPHFMQRCQPDIECSLSTNAHRYIEDFKCTNELLKSRDFAYITTSWPSGHASIIFYSMLYLIYYMHTVIPAINKLRPAHRFHSKLSPLFMNSIYVLMVCLAVYVSLTRVSDYHHHPTDVLSGTILGSVLAYAFASHIFRPKIESILPKVS